jgi:nitronate monooxygenase
MPRWPTTALTERLGIRYPIIQAPMASASTPALAAAVSNAGGLGSHGFAMVPVDGLAAELEAIRARTNRPVNCNFFVHAEPADDPERDRRMAERLAPFYEELGVAPPAGRPVAPFPTFGERHLEILLDAMPAVVSFHFGLPPALHVEAIKAAGAFVIAAATTVEEAVWLEAHGADVICAQGIEAGGHRGTFLSAWPAAQLGTLALVPQVVDAVRCPVVAAGGIMDARGIAAALMLGAAGVQMGTAFLGCPEAKVAPQHRRALHAATDTRLTRAYSGRPARGIANRLIETLAPHEADIPDFPLQGAFTRPLQAAAAERSAVDLMQMWAGQAAPLVRERPAGELVDLLARATERLLAE